jgi:16S rRNA processing protein RimM
VSGPQDRLEVGRVGRPHGLDGSFHVTRPSVRLPSEGASVYVGGRRRAITRRAGTGQRPILRLEATATRAAAEALRGEPLLVDLAETTPLEPDEYWAHDLEGCRVHAGARSLGVVAELVAYPSCEVLRVRDDAGAELLVPLVHDAVERVDLSAREILVSAEFLGLAPGT